MLKSKKTFPVLFAFNDHFVAHASVKVFLFELNLNWRAKKVPKFVIQAEDFLHLFNVRNKHQPNTAFQTIDHLDSSWHSGEEKCFFSSLRANRQPRNFPMWSFFPIFIIILTVFFTPALLSRLDTDVWVHSRSKWKNQPFYYSETNVTQFLSFLTYVPFQHSEWEASFHTSRLSLTDHCSGGWWIHFLLQRRKGSSKEQQIFGGGKKLPMYYSLTLQTDLKFV